MKYNIYLKRKDGTYKVSDGECKPEEVSRQLSLYLFRHYPVYFCDDDLGAGDMEKVLRDTRTALIVWRQGDKSCNLPEGCFYTEEVLLCDEYKQTLRGAGN